MIRLIVKIFPLTLFLSSASWAACGGSCSGGGSILRMTEFSRWILVDLLTTDEMAKRHLSSSPLQSIEQTSVCSKPIVIPWPLQEEVVYQELLKTIEAQRKEISETAPLGLFLDLVHRSLTKMNFFRFNCSLPLTKKIYISDYLRSLRSIQIETAVMYVPTFGTTISEPLWKQLDSKTKWGLLLHEAIRQIQMFYNFVDLSDKNLQLLVATMVTEGFISQNIEKYFSPMLARYVQSLSLSGDFMDEYGNLFSIFELSQKNRSKNSSFAEMQRLLDILTTPPTSDQSY